MFFFIVVPFSFSFQPCSSIITSFNILLLFFHYYFPSSESDTDTEIICKLIKYIYDRDQASEDENKLTFSELVEQTISQLEGGSIFNSLGGGTCPWVQGLGHFSRIIVSGFWEQSPWEW